MAERCPFCGVLLAGTNPDWRQAHHPNCTRWD